MSEIQLPKWNPVNKQSDFFFFYLQLVALRPFFLLFFFLFFFCACPGRQESCGGEEEDKSVSWNVGHLIVWNGTASPNSTPWACKVKYLPFKQGANPTLLHDSNALYHLLGPLLSHLQLRKSAKLHSHYSRRKGSLPWPARNAISNAINLTRS